MDYSLTGFNEDVFIISLTEIYGDPINFEFKISEFDKDISFDLFADFVGERIDSNYNYSEDYFDNGYIGDLIKCLYNYYFCHNEVSFKTGESLTVYSNVKYYNCTPYDFQLNFMLEKYPSIWNKLYSSTTSNTDYQLFISEISKTNNQLWKLELIMTKKSSDRYSLGGRFKFFVKPGDVINLKYYEHPLYNVKAEIVSIDYNSITFNFSGYHKPSMLHDIE